MDLIRAVHRISGNRRGSERACLFPVWRRLGAGIVRWRRPKRLMELLFLVRIRVLGKRRNLTQDKNQSLHRKERCQSLDWLKRKNGIGLDHYIYPLVHMGTCSEEK